MSTIASKDGTEIYYKEWGEGPPLILVPGLAGGYELLGPLARLLAGHFRVISYQLRGEEEISMPMTSINTVWPRERSNSPQVQPHCRRKHCLALGVQ